MNLLGITRSSNQDVASGYGPAIQEAELVAYCHSNRHVLLETLYITEPATIAYEDRELFRAAIEKAKHLKSAGQCDGIILSRCDRLSRQMEGAIQVALDLKKTGLSIVLVRENQLLTSDDQPIALVMFILQSFGVDTQTRIFLKNTREGQRKAAEAGKLPSGVGGRGLYGYNLIGPKGEKKFESNADIWIVDEVLNLGYGGFSINQITRDLREKGVRITRDTVRKILKHARVYAGVYRWGGMEIVGLVPPRTTLEQAKAIEANMQSNKEQSYGWGKRKWLTGRVRCGICGGSYALELGKKRCHCRRANDLDRLTTPCRAPKISYKKLEAIVWEALIANIIQPEVLKQRLVELRRRWEVERDKLRHQHNDLANQIERLKDKKDRLLWQHAEGFIADKELRKRYNAIDPIIKSLDERAVQMRAIAAQPAPPDPEHTDILGQIGWSFQWVNTKLSATDEQKAKIAETFGLHVTVFPAEASQLRLQIGAKIPLVVGEITVNDKGKHSEIVCPSLLRR
jgi:DNA invertase Pin-like site-specific DNA recombinase